MYKYWESLLRKYNLGYNTYNKKWKRNGSDEMEFKPLPIGIDDFEKLITRGYYFVDKTLLIKDLLDNKVDVNFVYKTKKVWKDFKYEHASIFFWKQWKG